MQDDVALDPGDIVRLTSGGPNMMVERVVDVTRIICIWFDARRVRGTFQKADLTKATVS